jgi:2-hydroxychromene-2-carboxylate isomerase
MTAAKLEFFFDCSSPWTYLAFERAQPIVIEAGATLVWRPILVGGLFNAVNPGVEYFKSMETKPQRKTAYHNKDLADWARLVGIEIRFPPAGHPVNSVKVMRACLVLEPLGKLVPFARAAFQAYFGHERQISDDAVIADLCRTVDVDAEWLLARIAEPGVKAALRANVDEAIARGAFGSPTMYVNASDMYFGQDRLPLVRDALLRIRASR